MTEYKLVPYKSEDYDFVYQTKKEAYQKYVVENWGKWDEFVQRKYFDDFIKTFGVSTQIVLVDGKKAGFVNGEFLSDDTFELGNICLTFEFRGKGLGTQILSDIIKNHQNKDIVLRVFKSNPAIHLYKWLGFELTEEQKFHYQLKRSKNAWNYAFFCCVKFCFLIIYWYKIKKRKD